MKKGRVTGNQALRQTKSQNKWRAMAEWIRAHDSGVFDWPSVGSSPGATQVYSAVKYK